MLENKKTSSLANSTHGGQNFYKVNCYLFKINKLPHIKNVTYYQNKGDTISESEIALWYVWIPRYTYTII